MDSNSPRARHDRYVRARAAVDAVERAAEVKDSNDAIDKALRHNPFPRPKTMHTMRFEDMSREGRLEVFRQKDGDVVIQVSKGECGDYAYAAVEFCTPMTGGGSSQHTHRALVALMVAMEKDDEERKQNRNG